MPFCFNLSRSRPTYHFLAFSTGLLSFLTFKSRLPQGGSEEKRKKEKYYELINNIGIICILHNVCNQIQSIFKR